MNKFTNWKNATDYELRRGIAERLGWQFNEENGDKLLVHPDGTRHRFVPECFQSWEFIASDNLPAWLEDTDTALSLPIGDFHWLIGRVESGLFTVALVKFELDDNEPIFYDSLAKAASIAWLICTDK